jgi:hypothetical protein
MTVIDSCTGPLPSPAYVCTYCTLSGCVRESVFGADRPDCEAPRVPVCPEQADMSNTVGNEVVSVREGCRFRVIQCASYY